MGIMQKPRQEPPVPPSHDWVRGSRGVRGKGGEGFGAAVPATMGSERLENRAGDHPFPFVEAAIFAAMLLAPSPSRES